MNTQVSSTDQEGHEQEQNQKVGQRTFDLIQDLQKPENMKELKGMLKNRAWGDTLGLLQEMNKTYQNVRDLSLQTRAFFVNFFDWWLRLRGLQMAGLFSSFCKRFLL